MAENDVLSVVQDLIETCKDGETGYIHAAAAVSDPSLKSYFQQQSTERHHFLMELKELSARLGESQPDTSGSVAAVLHRAWFETKADVGMGDGAVLSSVETGEDSAKDAYQKALQAALPEQVRAVISRQAQSVTDAHNRVRALRDRAQAA
jgi:uncharacterized protein (TIGR02284 family)